jgi:hypothetical protein
MQILCVLLTVVMVDVPDPRLYELLNKVVWIYCVVNPFIKYPGYPLKCTCSRRLSNGQQSQHYSDFRIWASQEYYNLPPGASTKHYDDVLIIAVVKIFRMSLRFCL